MLLSILSDDTRWFGVADKSNATLIVSSSVSYRTIFDLALLMLEMCVHSVNL